MMDGILDGKYVSQNFQKFARALDGKLKKSSVLRSRNIIPQGTPTKETFA